jgi:hypothetical protein
MRADKVIEALDGCAAAGRKIAALVGRKPLSGCTISQWKNNGIPPLWQHIIKTHRHELGLKTYDLMDCQES